MRQVDEDQVIGMAIAGDRAAQAHIFDIELGFSQSREGLGQGAIAALDGKGQGHTVAVCGACQLFRQDEIAAVAVGDIGAEAAIEVEVALVEAEVYITQIMGVGDGEGGIGSLTALDHVQSFVNGGAGCDLQTPIR